MQDPEAALGLLRVRRGNAMRGDAGPYLVRVAQAGYVASYPATNSGQPLQVRHVKRRFRLADWSLVGSHWDVEASGPLAELLGVPNSVEAPPGPDSYLPAPSLSQAFNYNSSASHSSSLQTASSLHVCRQMGPKVSTKVGSTVA
ncbi:hypothetical protein FKW77_006075 [Venturia effusa]|uniref:Uncharacterized protein n=1 Tax=Venturia effusa TaxID=50376 RepID=A0A517LHC0_9PEZI|nr:hypothetical protein FKW77_006075 [Venturia effusa]